MPDKLSHKAIAVRAGCDLAMLPEEHQLTGLKVFFNNLDSKSRKRKMNNFLLYLNEPELKYSQMDQWMETTFTKNPKLKPITIAHMYMKAAKRPKKYKRCYLQHAQRNKKRICKRIERQKAKTALSRITPESGNTELNQ